MYSFILTHFISQMGGWMGEFNTTSTKNKKNVLETGEPTQELGQVHSWLRIKRMAQDEI